MRPPSLGHCLEQHHIILKTQEDEVVTSYDVVALFMSIPPNVAPQVVQNRLESDQTLQECTKLSMDNLVELIKLCLKTTHFFFRLEESFTHKYTAVPWGPPVSPIVANLCMEAIKKQVLHTYTGMSPRLWLCYVDNTFVGLPQKEIDPFF